MSLGRVAGLGTELAIAVGLGLLAGRWLDSKLGTAPWLLMAGAALGGISAFWNLYRQVAVSNASAGQGKRDDERSDD
jgi:F0F1-type ATP synthase assembly protein I